MLYLDDIVSNKKKISSENDDWPFRMLIIGPSGSGKTDTDEEKYQYLINKREQAE